MRFSQVSRRKKRSKKLDENVTIPRGVGDAVRQEQTATRCGEIHAKEFGI
jgi:hypothetical protein